MNVLKWIMISGAALGARSLWLRRRATKVPGGNYDGVSALFATRENADRAVEHLVQQHGVDRSAIFIEPVAGDNSAGTRVSGGDAGSASPRDHDRSDAPLNGALRLTVGASDREHAAVSRALDQLGGTEVAALGSHEAAARSGAEPRPSAVAGWHH